MTIKFFDSESFYEFCLKNAYKIVWIDGKGNGRFYNIL